VVALPEAHPGAALPTGIVVEDVTPRKPAPGPFAAGQQWVGTYRCAQGETDLVLRILHVDGARVDAVFDFEHVGSGAAGSYEVHGTVDPETHEVSLAPGAWRRRPRGYESVGMVGRASGERFEGRMDNAACGTFSVTLDAAADEEDSD
jgi:hypothetical protein